jgi:hypothetical protein
LRILFDFDLEANGFKLIVRNAAQDPKKDISAGFTLRDIAPSSISFHAS